MRLAVFALFLCLLCACTQAQPRPDDTAPRPQPWQASGKTFTLRHGGVLKLGGRTLQMTGLMRLDTGANRADVAIFNPFGLKLAVLGVTPKRTEIRQISPMARRIPHFAQQAGAVVRTLFLQAASPTEVPSVQYRGVRRIDHFSFPETTTYTEPQHGYTVILRLKDGQVHD
ncbi:hypothetical protein [Salidesulfovibrio onnuriiensis]|uniref:hypothetical protein n=1 Tax=Salidesulfovibrio onnuriiensis TaxID=2583823 RepID=UPI0011CBFE68|nr:hypothetical protein [Salidesulfovibrio onnuriiensis]